MKWSLAELESLSKKATRGAGYAWGLSEEAGKSARWLCAMGLPGADCLAGLLASTDGAAYDQIRPTSIDTDAWAAAGGTLCPLITGATICDLACDLANGRKITLGATAFPLLLFPYVAAASDMTQSPLTLSWPGLTLTRDAGLSYLSKQDDTTPMLSRVETIQIAHSDTRDGTLVRRSYRSDISAPVAAQLGALAHRTYAPDTEASRLSGAGAGLTDND